MSDASAVAWDRFSSDPRSQHNAPLRASDLDRSVALDALAAAYADGRLDRGEFDERSDGVRSSKTLGQLVAPLRDLAPDPANGGVVRSSPGQLQARAEHKYAQARLAALNWFLVPSLICWVIWLATTFGPAASGQHFPWPIFVSAFTAIRLIQVMVNKRQIIDSIKEREQRKEQRRIQERPR